MRPFLGVSAVLVCGPDRGACDFLGEALEGLEVFVERGVLACCLEAVGEEGEGRCELCDGHIVPIGVYFVVLVYVACHLAVVRGIYILLSTLQV